MVEHARAFVNICQGKYHTISKSYFGALQVLCYWLYAKLDTIAICAKKSVFWRIPGVNKAKHKSSYYIVDIEIVVEP